MLIRRPGEKNLKKPGLGLTVLIMIPALYCALLSPETTAPVPHWILVFTVRRTHHDFIFRSPTPSRSLDRLCVASLCGFALCASLRGLRSNLARDVALVSPPSSPPHAANSSTAYVFVDYNPPLRPTTHRHCRHVSAATAPTSSSPRPVPPS
ncbi:hypothetical protein C8J57DRAFT_129693 [Mycena rebaudengoi]|nr:hypothetical protein C8J57DRAFT_129693 [Mycena rebaudengoi]